ncbi:MAG: Fe-S protein assembly co-chaperone HscB [Planctomycetes bacterium]|nr:Fe-S protein assembly co-chaperone HscB [Planctomycetota bacterium]
MSPSGLASPSGTPDPFTVFGLPHTLDLDETALERRYLRLSRECHPDLHRAADTADCMAVLQRAAEINDAWRVLRDPWLRTKALLELLRPGVLQQHQKLDPGFLAEALELAEEVAFASGAAVPQLRERLTTALAADFAAVRTAVLQGDLDTAARRCHAANYHKKALADLDLKS